MKKLEKFKIAPQAKFVKFKVKHLWKYQQFVMIKHPPLLDYSIEVFKFLGFSLRIFSSLSTFVGEKVEKQLH